jgi:hypothetical protein
MKKVLAGCLIVLVIAMIGFGAAAFYAYRAMQPVIDNASSYMDKAREVTRLGDGITNTRPFEAPKNGELTAAQVERFVAVQTRVRADLDGHWAEIEKQAAAITAQDAAEFARVFSQIAGIYLEGRKAQVNALNVQRFSESEYAWVRRRVYEAAGVELAGNIDLSRIEALAGTHAVRIPPVDLPKPPEKNVQLVKPHAAKIRQWMPLAALGL